MTDNSLGNIASSLQRVGLLSPDADPQLGSRTGCQAPHIRLAREGSAEFVAKRALANRRVVADWRAPVGRNASEVAWFRRAREVVPDAVPAILEHGAAQGFFAM